MSVTLPLVNTLNFAHHNYHHYPFDNRYIFIRQVAIMGTVQYCVLLSYHAAYFQNSPPVYQRTPTGQYTCSYMGSLATVDAENESAGRNKSARLMWIFTRVRHPFPPR
jgi:hypothetical protein